MQNVLRARLWDRFGHVPDAADKIENVLSSVLSGQFPPGWRREDVVEAFVDAFDAIWVAGVVAAAVAFVFVAALRQHTLLTSR